ncbi:MAG: hypothetical protein RI885_433 [Actinomycetota bacterium]
MPDRSPATDFSVALLGALVARGVRDVVLSPGSRSQALALAAAEFERRGILRLHVRIDERVAGFLALGLAVESRMPVVVVTTSGTAVANLHPAVLEAHHSGVPLILLTADRPSELRGIGSNQTTDQPGIFGSAVSFVRDVEAPTGSPAVDSARHLAGEMFAAAAGHSSPAGPVQVNLAFREPLSGAISPFPDAAEPTLGAAGRRGRPEAPGAMPNDVAAKAAPDGSAITWLAPHDGATLELAPVDGTVVVAGHAAGDRAEELARALGAPLLAEVSSGARFGPNLVVAYRELLADPAFGGAVRRAVVLGHPTLSREIPALLQRADVEVVIVRAPGSEAYNPGRRAAAIVGSVSYGGVAAERSWAGRWVQASRGILDAGSASGSGSRIPSGVEADPRAATPPLAREQLDVFRQPVTRRMLVDAVWLATWPHDRLVLGASRLIREADRVVGGRRITVHANRGLAGIDGTIATASGIALAAARAAGGVTRVLVGDLTLLHDVGALLLRESEPRPALQVIVGNDGGGTIFDGLEVAATARTEAVDRVLYTPQSVGVRALAEAYGWTYRRASNRGELDAALAATSEPTIVEVPLPR